MRTPGQLMAERSERERLDIHNRLTLFPLSITQENEQILQKVERPESQTQKKVYINSVIDKQSLELDRRLAQQEFKIHTLLEIVTQLKSAIKKKRISKYD